MTVGPLLLLGFYYADQPIRMKNVFFLTLGPRGLIVHQRPKAITVQGNGYSNTFSADLPSGLESA